ncbi:hypothetical protein PG996_004911 [Apiospora saccharicola]|uniref:Uncharacterized protein n=1 Tax=Apiospora saccharicola TaxID=335842 RepID=A0ABR1VJZ3_9PEZI
MWALKSALAQDRSEWIQRMYARVTKPGPVEVKRLCFGAGGMIAGVTVCYIALCLLGFVVLGRLCEYAVLRKYLGVCGPEAGSAPIDVYSSVLANFSKVLVHHDAYVDLSRNFSITFVGTGALSGALQLPATKRNYIETTRCLVEEYGTQLAEARDAVRGFHFSLHTGGHRIESTTDMLVDYYMGDVSGKMAYVWELLGNPHDSALEYLESEFLECVNATLQIFDKMQGNADNAKAKSDQLGLLLGRLADSAQYGLSVIQDDREKRQWEGSVYAHVPCQWTNFCGLLRRPRPIRLAHDVESCLDILNKTTKHSNKAGAALGSIRAVHDGNTNTIRKATQALGGLLTGANKTMEPHRKSHKKALVMEWKRGRRQLRKCLSDISAIRDSFESYYRDAKPLKQPPPSFEFPTLSI